MYYANAFGFFALFTVVKWVLVVLFIMWIVRMARSDGYRFRNWHAGPGGKTALDLLKERYAKGEISKAEFDEKRKDIAES